MRHTIKTALLMVICTACGNPTQTSDNYAYQAKAEVNMPIIQTSYTADPAPVVVNDTVYLYTSHDEDYAEGFQMKNWLLYTSTDMVNWQDRGIVASFKDFKWYKGNNGAWAIQVVERKGKWYMYCPIHGHGIGVLVADSPYGPFEDPIGKPLVWQREHWDDIDPTVFVDNDGQAYMYWGNHPGIIDYKGRSYCFGQNYDLYRLETDLHAERRSISLAEITYNADGTIQELPYFHECTLRPAAEDFLHYTAQGYRMLGSRFAEVALKLQGIKPWDSKYTININTEMNYWPAEVTNLSECHEPALRTCRSACSFEIE